MATSGFFITYLFHLGIGKGNQAFKFFADGMSSESIHGAGATCRQRGNGLGGTPRSATVFPTLFLVVCIQDLVLWARDAGHHLAMQTTPALALGYGHADNLRPGQACSLQILFRAQPPRASHCQINL